MIFWTKFTQRRYFRSTPNKSKHDNWILCISVSLGSKFELKLTDDFDFWTKFPNKSITGHIRINLCAKFQFSLKFSFFDQYYPKKYILVKNAKCKHHHWILHIQISLSTKFQLKQAIYCFGPNLTKNSISGLIQKKWASLLNSVYSN